MKENLSLPFQVESLIRNLLSKNESVYIRNNFRQTLDNTRVAIDKAIKQFDHEYNMEQAKKRSKS